MMKLRTPAALLHMLFSGTGDIKQRKLEKDEKSAKY